MLLHTDKKHENINMKLPYSDMKLTVLCDRSLEKPIAGQRPVEQYSAAKSTNKRAYAILGGGYLLGPPSTFPSRSNRTRAANV
jgi:hypothetical protein